MYDHAKWVFLNALAPRTVIVCEHDSLHLEFPIKRKLQDWRCDLASTNQPLFNKVSKQSRTELLKNFFQENCPKVSKTSMKKRWCFKPSKKYVWLLKLENGIWKNLCSLFGISNVYYNTHTSKVISYIIVSSTITCEKVCSLFTYLTWWIDDCVQILKYNIRRPKE